MHRAIFIIACMILSTFAIYAADSHMIDLVAAGKVKVARASWWGFDPDDSTHALQSAINSGAKKVLVDNVGKPWIVRPITLRSNQTIVFEPGTEVIAKRGEFKGRNDCLFTADNKENITLVGYGARLRMWRSDYDAPPYEKAEWRHVLCFRSCSNVSIRGLTLAESGGDGVYLGTATRGVTNKNVHIKDVTCERNYRQGISVITAENLLIENTVMRETEGTPPQAGIDFEPNRPEERLVNVVMRNCLTSSNRGDGYEIYLAALDAGSEPVSMRIENCRSVGDNYSVRIATGNGPGRAVRGSIEFTNCIFEQGRKSGVAISNKPVDGCNVRFANCVVINPGTNQPNAAAFLLTAGKEAVQPIGSIDISGCVIRNLLSAQLFKFVHGPSTPPLQEIFGTVILEKDGQREKIEVTPESIQTGGGA